ncbi:MULTISPECIES: hypothetical protein [Mycobacterium avium complex (MAC)]|jgi:hypothetical protein|uniref:Uncharacterized protein n=5 Tax=Mycobacterium avium complex (MAC) TaxID=120793 RepID=A0AAI8SP79_MYCAV|nr:MULTISPECIES: hypothetical protein [Mycobacterium avium complex (MAC)]ETZ40842.1 hypothetical protein L838_5523 [Mycobacterium avium MAV_120709_2344]EUA36161.1 hypothetical protein I549_3097 [Mycobacterium avium subsp. avium 2285 (R)]BAN31212.1 hypothetical protein MAH_2138 [Mycobacterium avium subsp. hominissuis TH135]AYJ04492.1 hypothetical protein DBO90_06465 [Mycobacterium avium]ETZ51115.1 hypothetical protein L837_1883 [Mycobacterium avium MAV_061107_1842]
MFDGCVGRAFASTKGCLMAGLKRFVFALILVLTAVLMGGCSAACGQPSWLLRVAGDSIGNDTPGLNVSAANQVCVTGSIGG